MRKMRHTIMPADGDDEAGQHWMNGVSCEWSDDLSDPREDIYSLDDGTPSWQST
jgi:hypothetical protein